MKKNKKGEEMSRLISIKEFSGIMFPKAGLPGRKIDKDKNRYIIELPPEYIDQEKLDVTVREDEITVKTRGDSFHYFYYEEFPDTIDVDKAKIEKKGEKVVIILPLSESSELKVKKLRL